MNETAPKLLYTINEVSASLCMGRTTVYAEIKKGNLHSLKVGKKRLVPADSLKKWVENITFNQSSSV